MSTSLAVQAGADVAIWLFDMESGRNDVLMDLWKALRQTSVDVAESPAQDIWKWAESCVYIAQVQKLVLPLVPSLQQKSSSHKSSDDSGRAWGKVEKAWWAPTKLGFNDPQTGHPTPKDFSYVDKDFHSRVGELPEDVKNLGSLHEYAPLYLKQNNITKLYHVYLYDHILLFVNDAESSSPVSPDIPRLSPLKVVGVVHIADIKDICHMFERIGDYPAYALALDVLMVDDRQHSMSLILPTPWSFWSWSTALRERMSGPSRTTWAITQTDFLTKGLLAVTQWPFKSVPLHTYGGLRKYAPVTIRNEGTSAQVGAYLFDNHLVFMYKTRQRDLRVLRDINLAEVTTVYNQSRTVCLVVEGDDPSPWVVNLQFECEYRTAASNWVSMLERRPRDSDSRSSKLASKSTSSLPLAPAWYLSGIVSLSSSADSANEYNISVAILAKYTGDGLATHAVANALKVAFEKLHAHRVQARILHGAGSTNARDAVSRFIHWGFTHEGTRRRVVIDPKSGSWADMSVLSLLDTEWALRETKRPPEQTPWDELFVRHQRERDALFMVEGGASVQLLRGQFLDNTPTQSAVSDVESSENMSSVPGMKFVHPVAAQSSTLRGSETGTGSSWAAVLDVPDNAEPMSDQIRRWIEQQTLDPPDSTGVEFSPESESCVGDKYGVREPALHDTDDD